jgi:septal ring factor EnvC (AmiA/AmiB activator)
LTIIFLTGCARQGYHTVQPAGPAFVAAGDSQPFAWPLEGRVAVPFGARENGVRTKGVVIEAKEGSAVVASRDGRVQFVEDGMPGYGRTVVIEHSPEFSTVYARNAEVLVALGQWVRRGETIARAGRSARGEAPQLYFEIRRKSRAVDPIQFLRSS